MLTTADPHALDWRAPILPSPPVMRPHSRGAGWLPSGLAEWFAVSQTLLPALMFMPGSQAIRLPLRVGAYGISLFVFAWWWFNRGSERSARHPAEPWLMLVCAYLVLMIVHPGTYSVLSGVAQTVLYVAIFCPVFWAPAYVQTPRQLARILVILLVCNGLNSLVGVLQVYDPARWMPPELSSLYTGDALAAATYIGRNGRLVIRPPGLFDTPGAVCAAGTVAVLLGLILAIEPIVWWKRGAALLFATAGISAIYLSHVRAAFLVTLGSLAVYMGLLALQGERKRLSGFVAATAGLLAAGLAIAVLLGGQSVQDRFLTLLDGDPGQVYFESRGVQLESAFSTLLVKYPFGAGLGRWGMMHSYFGATGSAESSEVFAEIQPNAWIVDGGILLLGLYALVLALTAAAALKLFRSLADGNNRLLAAAVIAANFGTLALVFSFVPFGTAVGSQFWFFEGALYGAMVHQMARRQTA
jgi:hypothetical protein